MTTDSNNISIKTVIQSPIKALWKVSLPVILVGIVETLYYVVDTIYIGRLGASELAAVTFFGPIYFIMLAISLGINAGLGARISRLIGAQKQKEAEKTATFGFIISIILGIIVSIVLLLVGKFILQITGATLEIQSIAWKYSWIMICSSIFMFGAYALNSVFVAQGDSKTAMILDTFSLGLNIILTPLFVFGLTWGVAGAAFGTFLSLLFGFLQAIYFMHTRSRIKLQGIPQLKHNLYNKSALMDILKIGMPSTGSMFIIGVYVFFLNTIFAYYSMAHVAAAGIVSKLEMVVILPLYGLSVGAMTICGMLYGAKKYELISKVCWYAVGWGILVSSLIGLIFILFSSFFIGIFSSDVMIISLAFPLLIFDVFTFPTMAFTMISTRALQGIGHGMPVLIIHIIRIFCVAIPLAYFFTYVLHKNYLWVGAAMVISGIIASIVLLIWQNKILSQILSQKKRR